jgi:hypothetical protein
MKALYQEIRARLEAETSAAHVRLWNNQIDSAEQNKEIPHLFPAIFIDFPMIEWFQKGKGTQNADMMTVRLYICNESFHTAENDEDVAIFDLREEVFLALQDWKPTHAGKLERRTEQTDTRHTNIYTWIIDFTTSYQEVTAQFPRNSQTATIDTVTFIKDFQISSGTTDGIRTDKEFP